MPNDIPAMQAWYAKTFGGVPGRRQRMSSPGLIDCDDIPGANLSFSPKGKLTLAPTKGRSLDHIGFDVKDLDLRFTKKLEAQGIKLDEAVRLAPNGTTKVAYLTDPWGTRIELTQNLAPGAAPECSPNNLALCTRSARWFEYKKLTILTCLASLTLLGYLCDACRGVYARLRRCAEIPSVPLQTFPAQEFGLLPAVRGHLEVKW